MTFLSPAGFWLSILLPLVVLLYLLKLRRTEVLVSSTFLWKKALEDMHANAPFQKLVKNLLLYAQLLALAALVFALARPLLAGGLARSRSMAILIDTSASMQATDVKPSRIEVAKAEALKLVEGMSGRDEAMILTFDARPRILAPLTKEKEPLKEVLKGVSASDAPGSIREALIIASSILKGEDRVIVILSDGRCRGLDAPVDDRIDVRYLKIGERGVNAGITALDARPSEDGSGRQQLFVETRAVGGLTKGTLSLYRDGGLVDARKVNWEAGKAGNAVFDLACTSETRLKVSLESGKGGDDLAADDTAFAVLADRPRQRVLLVTQGNYFLERLLNLEKQADLFSVAPKDYKAGGDWSLVVFDRWAPEALAPGRYLFVGAVPPLEGFKALGTSEHPLVLDWKRGHPLLRFANFNGLQIRKSLRMELPDWAVPILESSEGPLVVSADRRGVKLAVVAFDLFDSDWPFRLSFPVFVSNAVRTLGAEGLGENRALRPGESFTWRTEGKAEALSVKRPDGSAASIPFHGEETAVFADTLKAGVYEASDGKAKRAYAVALRSAEESETTPVDSNAFMLSGKKVAAAGSSLDQKELWAWFAIAALGLLCLEWAMYHRRWL